MTKDNEDALLCADALEGKRVYDDSIEWAETLDQSAAHLRRLVAENEREREARIKAQEQVADLQARIARADVERQRAVQAKEREAKSIWREDQARIKQLHAENEAKDALLRQAVVLADDLARYYPGSSIPELVEPLRAAIRQHLEGQP